MHAKLFQSCLSLCSPIDCSLPGSSVHMILQARTLKWVTMTSFRGSSRPRHQTYISCISCIGWQIFTTSATLEAQDNCIWRYSAAFPYISFRLLSSSVIADPTPCPHSSFTSFPIFSHLYHFFTCLLLETFSFPKALKLLINVRGGEKAILVMEKMYSPIQECLLRIFIS